MNNFITYGEHIAEGRRGTLVMFDQPTADELAMLVLPYTYCPNVATTLDDSNWDYIREELDTVDPDGNDHQVASFGHWATAYDLMLVRPGSKAHDVAVELMDRLANHPVLDEDDLSEREEEAYSDSLAEALNSLTIEVNGVEIGSDKLTNMSREYHALWHAVDTELTQSETPEYVDRSDLEEALRDLGFTYDEAEFTWRGTLPVEETSE